MSCIAFQYLFLIHRLILHQGTPSGDTQPFSNVRKCATVSERIVFIDHQNITLDFLQYQYCISFWFPYTNVNLQHCFLFIFIYFLPH